MRRGTPPHLAPRTLTPTPTPTPSPTPTLTLARHAAHFANIQMPSPLFSQERAPTSVAYAELQSMFLDSLVGDAAWRCKCAGYCHPVHTTQSPNRVP